MDVLQSYRKIREEIYSPLKEEGLFTWETMYGQEYALATIKKVTRSFILEIQEATSQLGKIFAKTVNIVQNGTEELLEELGLPSETWQTVRLVVDPSLATVVGRFDFAYTKNGLKMLEYNSDTPSGIVEAFYVNEKVCRFFQVPNPNHGYHKHIQSAFQHMKQQYQQLGYETQNIVFSSLGDHIEDRGTTQYLMRESGLDASFVPLSDLALRKDGLYAPDQQTNEYQRIDLLFRLHPLEIMAKERDEQNVPVGAYLLYLISKRKLAIINPPNAFIAQTKALQAIIWNLHEQGHPFFNREEHEVIRTYMLPTYLDNTFLGKKRYVRKPFFGREGGAVTLFDKTGQPFDKDRNQDYWDQPMIYQEFAELETIKVPTLKGQFQGKLLWGAFLIGGTPSAVLARVDRNITGDMSYLLPIGLTG